MRKTLGLVALVSLLGMGTAVQAQDGQSNETQSGDAWYSGDWSLTIGGAVIALPEYEGSKDYRALFQPMVSLGKSGPARRFTSRNDNISFGLIDTGAFRAGPTGKIVFGRDSNDYSQLRGLDDLRWGVELGGFAEVYPTDWMRVRGEVRHGIRAHNGVVADVAVDAFTDVTPDIRISGGPRASYGNGKYNETYFGVTPEESIASGLSEYDAGSGFKSVGVGGAVTWKATDKVETSLFGEYGRLVDEAAKSSLVEERGDKNQFTVGVSATYRFDFTF